MKSPRLLPVVIAAIAALMLFKGIGILTNGGYVLTGTAAAVASGPEAKPADAAATDAPTMQVPGDVTMTDSSPTLTDSSLTLPMKTDAASGDHGTASDHGSTSTDAGASGADHGANGVAQADAGHGSDATAAAATDCPPATPAAPADPNAQQGDLTQKFDFVAPPPDCTPDPGVNAAGDALPLEMTGDGKKVPMKSLDPNAGSADQVLERLAERRTELDKLAAELDMRQALIDAAEKRIDQRTAELQALEDKVNALVKEKETADQQQFVAIVAMYESMKPKDAAAIFDQLEMPVLLKVTRAMNPRKMAPILAAMSTTKAKDLTANLAADQGQQTIDVGQSDAGQLPQIVGQ